MVFEFFAVIFGEDVAFGGVFRCTVGLKDKYGKFLFLLLFKPLLFCCVVSYTSTLCWRSMFSLTNI